MLLCGGEAVLFVVGSLMCWCIESSSKAVWSCTMPISGTMYYSGKH